MHGPISLARSAFLGSLSILALFVIASTASPKLARAADGLTEINQACAINTGCMSGDAPGFPVTIGASGAYVLTSNLLVADVDVDALIVGAQGVSIDLRGFVITTTACIVNPGLSCRNTSAPGRGVASTANTIRNVEVRNGSIFGLGRGVDLVNDSVVSNVQVKWNGLEGIRVGAFSKVLDCTAFENGLSGIVTSDFGIITGNHSSFNAGAGINTSTAALVSHNSTSYNGTDGIRGFTDSTISENVSYGNTGDGIRADQGNTIIGNSVSTNGGDGIDALSGSTVARNSARGNASAGLRLAVDAAYRENTVSGSASVVGGVDMGSNSCNGNTFCP